MTPKISLVCLLLASLLFGVCFGTIKWTSKKLSNGRTAYFSANCDVDYSKLKFLDGTFDPSLTNCIDECNTLGANVFYSTLGQCLCYKRDKSVAPYPYKEVTDSTHYCGCIESTGSG